MSKWTRTIAMKDIKLIENLYGPIGVEDYIGYTAMRDTPMTDEVVEYGITLGVLLSDYTCGWSNMA